MAQPNGEHNYQTTDKELRGVPRAPAGCDPRGSCRQPKDTQCCDCECIRETSDGNHTAIVIELGIEIPVFC